MLDVLDYGFLLYGGIVLGLDCLVMLLVGEENICEVIVFFKNGKVIDLMNNVLSLVFLL